ncbi:XTP/dITP diphosphatase [bacterium]
MRIVIATRNKDKILEIKHYFADLDIEFVSLERYPLLPEIIEDKNTLIENAVKKAKEVSEFTDNIALADDSGLEVDALNGAPGVYSARFSGENATYDDNNKKLLNLLKDIPLEKRTAHFKTVLALVFPDSRIQTVEGRCEGIIINEMRGTNGFGYDPIFFVPRLNKTFAELTLHEKNTISHRAKALEKMKQILKSSLV